MKKILIVDDQTITLRMTSHILSTQYETFLATSGQEAIELYKTKRPDMVLSDLHMPVMSGFELQSTLQGMYSEHIPFMFMTADQDEEAESKGFENGAVDYIRKPFRADVLLRRVDNILQNVERLQGLKKAAETDPMTGLLNKASSQAEIGAKLLDTHGTVMMIDLDSFKHVNDIYGHDMGDKVLIQFAQIIQSAIRPQDIAGRMGGDEFIAFCMNVRDEEVIAEKSRYINEEVVKAAHRLMGDDMTIPLGASIGAVIVPEEGTDFLTIYKKADKALLTVKQNGKHGYAIYRESAGEADKSEEDFSGIANEIKFLKERNIKKGAFDLPYEQFQLLFRFLVRMEINYQKINHLIIFTLPDKYIGTTSMIDRFHDIVQQSLRASDVVTKKGKSAVMVLLLEAASNDATIAIQRVMDNWHKECPDVTPTIEMELIK